MKRHREERSGVGVLGDVARPNGFSRAGDLLEVVENHL